jgi:hypothetical protein
MIVYEPYYILDLGLTLAGIISNLQIPQAQAHFKDNCCVLPPRKRHQSINEPNVIECILPYDLKHAHLLEIEQGSRMNNIEKQCIQRRELG